MSGDGENLPNPSVKPGDHNNVKNRKRARLISAPHVNNTSAGPG